MKNNTANKKNLKKESYLDRITDQTSYPVLRSLTSILSNLLIALSIVNLGLGVLLSMQLRDESTLLMGLALVITIIISAVIYIFGRLLYEIASIFADIADSILDLNSRYDQ